MSIDDYGESFEHLTNKEFPRLMSELKQDIKQERSMEEFAIKGVGVVSLCKSYGLESDFSGCYLLLDKKKAVYTGISRSVLQRLKQHVCGRTHFDASLAYRIASTQMPHSYTRSKAMEQEDFKIQFGLSKSYLATLAVAYVKIHNPLTLYVFELYCVMHFDTSEWNTFETH